MSVKRAIPPRQEDRLVDWRPP